jgi:hypothetical protein
MCRVDARLEAEEQMLGFNLSGCPLKLPEEAFILV